MKLNTIQRLKIIKRKFELIGDMRGAALAYRLLQQVYRQRGTECVIDKSFGQSVEDNVRYLYDNNKKIKL